MAAPHYLYSLLPDIRACLRKDRFKKERRNIIFGALFENKYKN